MPAATMPAGGGDASLPSAVPWWARQCGGDGARQGGGGGLARRLWQGSRGEAKRRAHMALPRAVLPLGGLTDGRRCEVTPRSHRRRVHRAQSCNHARALERRGAGLRTYRGGHWRRAAHSGTEDRSKAASAWILAEPTCLGGQTEQTSLREQAEIRLLYRGQVQVSGMHGWWYCNTMQERGALAHAAQPWCMERTRWHGFLSRSPPAREGTAWPCRVRWATRERGTWTAALRAPHRSLSVGVCLSRLGRGLSQGPRRSGGATDEQCGVCARTSCVLRRWLPALPDGHTGHGCLGPAHANYRRAHLSVLS